MWSIRHILAMMGLISPSLAAAHPHVFVQAELTVIYDGSVPTAVRIDWIYDDYFSLLLTSDLGIDLDGDMVLTEEEKVTLNQAVTDWPDGFEGDLEIRQMGQLVQLGAKSDHHMSFENGIVTETHVRPLPEMGSDPFLIQPFDPFYFVAYDVINPIHFEGTESCAATVTRADMDAARALVADLTGGLAPEDVGVEENFPEVGHAFADTVMVSCAF